MVDLEVLKQTVKIWLANNKNAAETARQMGLGASTVKDRLRQAARLNVLDTAVGGETEPGFGLGRVSSYYRVGEDGTPTLRGQWVRKEPTEEEVGKFLDLIDDRMSRFEVTPLVTPEQWYGIARADLATIYPIADLHLGMLSWGKETGSDYDLNIAGQLLRTAMRDLVAQSPWSETAVILNLGDFFHADTNAARTPKSGNELDTDSRHDKALGAGIDLMMDAVAIARQKHKKVIVRNLRGNHDPYASRALAKALYYAYLHDENVEVWDNPTPFFWWNFGTTFVAAHHGDEITPEEFVHAMAALQPERWGRSKFRYAFSGHVHKSIKGGNEVHGAIYESFQTLAPRDAWGASKGYSAGRSMDSLTFHVDKGLVQRNRFPVIA